VTTAACLARRDLPVSASRSWRDCCPLPQSRSRRFRDSAYAGRQNSPSDYRVSSELAKSSRRSTRVVLARAASPSSDPWARSPTRFGPYGTHSPGCPRTCLVQHRHNGVHIDSREVAYSNGHGQIFLEAFSATSCTNGARAAEVFRLATTPCMVEWQSTPSREALHELFLRASARRAERRRFVDTLRKILEQRLLGQPLLLLRTDRRQVMRET
jgi:hypothetical protein